MENKIFSAESLKFRGNIKYISRTLKLTITNFKYDCMVDLEKKKKRAVWTYADFKMGRNECLLCDSNITVY